MSLRDRDNAGVCFNVETIFLHYTSIYFFRVLREFCICSKKKVGKRYLVITDFFLMIYLYIDVIYKYDLFLIFSIVFFFLNNYRQTVQRNSVIFFYSCLWKFLLFEITHIYTRLYTSSKYMTLASVPCCNLEKTMFHNIPNTIIVT